MDKIQDSDRLQIWGVGIGLMSAAIGLASVVTGIALIALRSHVNVGYGLIGIGSGALLVEIGGAALVWKAYKLKIKGES